MAQPVVRRHALLTGRVQGVGFRWRVREKAEHLGLTGWVCNLPDGRVEGLSGPVRPRGRDGGVAPPQGSCGRACPRSRVVRRADS